MQKQLQKQQKRAALQEFNKIKTQLYVKLNKNLPKDIDNINQIDVNSVFKKTLSGNKFLIFKNDTILILQSDIQAKIMKDNLNDIF